MAAVSIAITDPLDHHNHRRTPLAADSMPLLTALLLLRATSDASSSTAAASTSSSSAAAATGSATATATSTSSAAAATASRAAIVAAGHNSEGTLVLNEHGEYNGSCSVIASSVPDAAAGSCAG